MSQSVSVVNSHSLRPSRPSVPEVWGQWLHGYHWDWFYTLTFRDVSTVTSPQLHHVHPETAEKIFKLFIDTLNIEIYGHRYRRHKLGVYWCRADEYQIRGAIHYHGMIGGVPDRVRRMDYINYWYSHAGIARIYQYDKQRGASFYVAKCSYAFKRGQVSLGGMFPERATTPELFS